MRRREVIAGFATAALPWRTAAQQQRVYRLGLLGAGRAPTTDIAPWVAVTRGLRELGYIEGVNLVFEGRWAQGDIDRLPRIAGELAALNVDAILVFGPTPMRAAKAATQRIPIIMAAGSSDPIGEGYIASFARPGGNITGLTYAVSGERFQKQLEILKEAIPGLSRVGVWWDGDPEIYHRSWVPALDEAARRLGLAVEDVFLVRKPDDFDATLTSMTERQVDAVILSSSSITMENRHRAAEAALRHRLPVMAAFREFPEAGMLMSYGPNIAAIFHRSASFVDKVLKGIPAGEIPVEQPTKYDFVINLKAARALGIIVPLTLQAQADEVIE